MNITYWLAPLMFTLLSMVSYGQISTRTVQSAGSVNKALAPYDSLHNIDLTKPNEVEQYIGQEFYVRPRTPKYSTSSNNRSDYMSFVVKPEVIEYPHKEKVNNLYHSIEESIMGYITDPAAVEGKYFKILAVEEHTDKNGLKRKYFKLQEKEGNGILYYCIGRDESRDDKVRFLIVGFYEKLKALHVNKVYIYNGNEEETAIDLVKGVNVTVSPKSEWQCVDVTTTDISGYMSYSPVYVFKNAAGNEVPVSIKDWPGLAVKIEDFVTKEQYAQAEAKQKEADALKAQKDKADAELAKKQAQQNTAAAAAAKAKRKQDLVTKYGTTNGELIAAGQVKVGMTAAMCLDAWGKPSDVNKTTNAYGTTEQWVYNYKSYLYFENGILTSIQN